MPITQRNKIGMLEAMLFANAEPVETDRLAEAMRADPAEVLTLLEKLQKRYDETESGLMLLHFDGDRWQMATRPYYGEVVKRILAPMGNEVITLVKDTSLANTIANKEIIMMAKEYSAKGLIWPLFSTAIFFLVFVGALTLLFGWAEKKLDYFR